MVKSTFIWLSQTSRAAVALHRRPPQMGRNGPAERQRSSLTRLITLEVPPFSLPALPSRTWRPLNPPAALEGDLEKVERWAAADHAGPPEGLGSISDAWLRVTGWGGGWWRAGQLWGAETPGSFNRSCWTFFSSYFIWL